MKNALLLVFIAATVALGALCAVQWQRLAAQKTQVAALRTDVEQKTREILDLQAAQKLNEKQRQELFKQADDLAAKLQTHQLSEHKAAAAEGETVKDQKPDQDKNPFGNLLAKMMQDPDTRKMIREQQRSTLDQLYTPLIKQLGLTPEDAAKFKDLLSDNMMKAAEKASSLFGGATNRTEMLATLAAEQKDFDEQVRGFLGETGYAQYKDYQQTVGERTQLNQFKLQTAGGENALSDQQTEQLLAFMKEEKKKVAAATGQSAPGPEQDQANFQAMLSGDGAEKLLQSQELVNQQVYDRAKAVLSASQLESFGSFQTNQLQMMRMGMTMTRKFMAPSEQTERVPAVTKP